ncbi:HNH endonuclease [Kordiimonas sediminis]|uniref:HNH endonuclease n=1 Tax=Kordiimonas sediminis TaxID=1735581 RepID=A0A919ALK0_9PROT|nr:HNH endonuclease [Kordiimonas sediminis]GHF11637.1 HNH endonuclease [Kordiimonas sediminis]
MGVNFAPDGSGPGNCPALVLNADFRPLTYYPLSIWNWQTALKAVFLERVSILSEYEEEVHSPSFTMKLPSVIALKKYVRPARYPAFTRFNLFLRDQFTCQYCGTKTRSVKDLTFDHVTPRRLGGKTSWTNISAACSPCNLRKGGRTPAQAGMHLLQEPYKPTTFELNERGRAFPPNYLHESWRDFLYWDTELER